MRKIILVSLAAIMTAITIYFVFLWTPESVSNDVLVENKLEDKVTNKKEDISKDKYVNKEDKKEKVNNSKDEGNKDLNDLEENIDDIKGNTEIKKDTSLDEKKDKNKEEKEKKEEIESNAAVASKIFTVNKEEIVGMLSIKDKYQLVSLVNKLSTVDIEKILTSIKNKGEKEGCIEVFKLLKLRLTEEDYKKVKEILSPYINIDFVESLV